MPDGLFPNNSKSNYHKHRTYSEFILKDVFCHEEQMASLVALHQLQTLYRNKDALDSSEPLTNTFAENRCINTAFEMYKLGRAIRFNETITASEDITVFLTEQANFVFIYAMFYAHTSVIEYFIERKLINPNCSMFPSPNWPSYFLFACSCHPSVFNVFRNAWINYNIAWYGLGPGILCTINKIEPEKRRDLDFMTYQQYFYMNRYKGLIITNSIDPLPIFPLDFACLMKDVAEIKQILENTPEAGMLSRISFIVQCEEHIILIISRYGFSTDQQFNGNTPLHYSCFKGNFCILSMLLYLGFPIRTNVAGLYPNEVGTKSTREKTSIFFNLCASTPRAANTQHVENTLRATGTLQRSASSSAVRIFTPVAFKKNMTMWMQVLNFKESEFDKYVGIFRYLDFNKENRIYKKSRFSIITVFGLAKTAVSVEKQVNHLPLGPFAPPIYATQELVSLFTRYFVDAS